MELSVTPKTLDQGRFVFTISTRPAHKGIAFHVIITAKTGAIPPDSSVYVGSVTTMPDGARYSGPVKPDLQVTLQKDDRIWKADFVASSDLLKNSDVYVVFDVIAHVIENGKSVPMPSADMYEIKLRDFLKP